MEITMQHRSPRVLDAWLVAWNMDHACLSIPGLSVLPPRDLSLIVLLHDLGKPRGVSPLRRVDPLARMELVRVRSPGARSAYNHPIRQHRTEQTRKFRRRTRSYSAAKIRRAPSASSRTITAAGFTSPTNPALCPA